MSLAPGIRRSRQSTRTLVGVTRRRAAASSTVIVFSPTARLYSPAK